MSDSTKLYDVIVVGGGIPGLFAARELARADQQVLLLEASRDPELPNYSTAGIPAKTLSDYGLPSVTVNASIRHHVVGTSRKQVKKTAPGGSSYAYVLDFGKTKRLMGEQCLKEGAEVRYGERATDFELTDLGYRLRTTRGEYQTRRLIDASGSHGVLAVQAGLRPSHPDRPTVGMEYQIKSERSELSRFDQSIAIFYDAEILPHSYGWVFSDGPGVYKVGLIEYWVNPARGLPPLEKRLKGFISMLGINLQEPGYEVLAKHGGSKMISRRFSRVRAGDLYAIGDTIGAINPFFAEGIRQGLESARLAVAAILNGSPASYEKQWAAYKGPRWKLSEAFAYLYYDLCPAGFVDAFADAIVEVADRMNSEELQRLVFGYEFELVLKRAPLRSALALGGAVTSALRTLAREKE